MDRRARRSLHQFASTLPDGWGDQLLEHVGLASRRQQTHIALAIAAALLVAVLAAVGVIVAGRAADNVD